MIAVSALAWIPIVEPLVLEGIWWWAVAVPLCALISLGYKSVRGSATRRSPRAVLVMTAQLLLMLALLSTLVTLFAMLWIW